MREWRHFEWMSAKGMRGFSISFAGWTLMVYVIARFRFIRLSGNGVHGFSIKVPSMELVAYVVKG